MDWYETSKNTQTVKLGSVYAVGPKNPPLYRRKFRNLALSVPEFSFNDVLCLRSNKNN